MENTSFKEKNMIKAKSQFDFLYNTIIKSFLL